MNRGHFSYEEHQQQALQHLPVSDIPLCKPVSLYREKDEDRACLPCSSSGGSMKTHPVLCASSCDNKEPLAREKLASADPVGGHTEHCEERGGSNTDLSIS